MGLHHDTGYKELFSYPELVQQLIEGFIPSEIAALMDFSTLKNHNGHYITPLFEEKIEDVVWSVKLQDGANRLEVYLYILLEFQSSDAERVNILCTSSLKIKLLFPSPLAESGSSHPFQ
jgi:predicted transposase YdaD